MRNLDEFDLISRFFAPLSRGEVGAYGLCDDAAFLPPPPDRDLVITADAVVAGVHFLPDDPPETLAHKLMGVNMSDLAAKGAIPYVCLMTLALPRRTNESWVAAFASGLAEDVQRYGCPLVGGDTVATDGPLTLSLTALGTVPAGVRLLRSGAQVGDDIWVSGTLGDGAWGLAVAQGRLTGLVTEHIRFLLDRYRCPRPRLALASMLLSCAHSSLDVSDGLVQDLGHICTASGVGAWVDRCQIPLSRAGQAVQAMSESEADTPLVGGDDYEILFTASPEMRHHLDGAEKKFGVQLTRIGAITAGCGVVLRDKAGKYSTVPAGGWRHFDGGRKTE